MWSEASPVKRTKPLRQAKDLLSRARLLFSFKKQVKTAGATGGRGPITHVIIMDGTLSSLRDDYETNAGLTYKICRAAANIGDGKNNMLVRYEAGIQWTSLGDTMSVIEGRGINEQIQRVYGGLASRYRPGDKIFLFGYSRGGYAVRSLAGFIDKVGLLRKQEATERNIKIAYRHYQDDPDGQVARVFAAKHCHEHVSIEMLGVWDTVAAVGLHFPLLWRFSKVFHEFHNNLPPNCAKRVFHALAYHERRQAYEPVMFETNTQAHQVLEQVWFRGSHSDVGGQLSGRNPERLLPNATLVWMLGKAEHAGLKLPDGWRDAYPADANGCSIGMNHGWGWVFWVRRKRKPSGDVSERLHPSLKKADAEAICKTAP
jgi:uncharacterized protein (DUF2235 family)